MIPELDRYHGVVLRQLLLSSTRRVRIGVADSLGRLDAFHIESAAFQIKHSSRRLSPWQFTYATENLFELADLQKRYSPVWAFLVCGQDGVVGLTYDELRSIMPANENGPTWLRVSRSRNSMYRVAGPLGELPRAKARGVQAFVSEIVDKNQKQGDGADDGKS